MRTLRLGSTGEDVRKVQKALSLEQDGKFGPQTKAAVEAYQNNRNLVADGIVGEKTWNAMKEDVANKVLPANKDDPNPDPKPITFIQPVDFKQTDKRWKDIPYTLDAKKHPNQTIGSSGCGPTACADIVATCKVATITPVKMCEIAVKYGFRTDDDGTKQSFIKFVNDKFGFDKTKFKVTTSVKDIQACLAAGGYVVALMKKGAWTSGGHYIVPWKYNKTYIYANNPNTGSPYNIDHQKIADFQKELNKAWLLYQ